MVFVGGRWRAGVTSGWRQAMVSMCQWEELQRELEVVCGVVEVEIGENVRRRSGGMRRSRWSRSGMYVRDLDLAGVNVLFLEDVDSLNLT